MERPGFSECIVQEDLRKNIVIIPSKNNRRITKQVRNIELKLKRRNMRGFQLKFLLH